MFVILKEKWKNECKITWDSAFSSIPDGINVERRLNVFLFLSLSLCRKFCINTELIYGKVHSRHFLRSHQDLQNKITTHIMGSNHSQYRPPVSYRRHSYFGTSWGPSSASGFSQHGNNYHRPGRRSLGFAMAPPHRRKHSWIYWRKKNTSLYNSQPNFIHRTEYLLICVIELISIRFCKYILKRTETQHCFFFFFLVI